MVKRSECVGVWSGLAAAMPAVMMLLGAAASARAQCAAAGWVSGFGVPGVNGNVYAATMWDPDGAGPLGARVVVGGVFTSAGGVAANNVASWDPATGTWSSIGTGVTGIVYALAALPTGELAVGGAFTSGGGANLAKWNGTAWQSMRATSHSVRSLLVTANGDLIAGGDFITAGGVPAQHVARLHNGAWSAMGLGFNGSVLAIRELPTGEVLAGGAFSFSGGMPTSSVARWNGSAWVAMGPGLNGIVYALLPRSDGTIVAGGDFARSGSTFIQFIAKWNGVAWSGIGTGMDNIVFALGETATGEVVAAGGFAVADGATVSRIARRSDLGSAGSWTAFTSGADSVVHALLRLPQTVPVHAGEVLVGGQFHQAGGGAANGLALYSLGRARACAADVNCSGGLEVQDIFEFLEDWFGGGSEGDFNGGGGVTVQDIFDFLAAWFGGC